MRVGVVVVVLALLTASCADDPDDSASVVMRLSRSEFDDRQDDPTWFVGRESLPSCGEWVATVTSRRAADCFERAYEEGAPAELLTRQHLGNGDSMVDWWRVLGPGEYERFHRYVDPGVAFPAVLLWQYQRCTEIRFSADGWPSATPEDPFADPICLIKRETRSEPSIDAPTLERMRESYTCVVDRREPHYDC